MKRIMTVCGTGLGSSFLVEMNIQKILRELDRKSTRLNSSHCG